jgi:hypothetical protein
MQDISHLKLIAMSLLQTCSYVTEQMQTPVTIDVNKFMESFSIKANDDGGYAQAHPPTWIAGEDNSITFSPSTTIIPDSQSSSLSASRNPFTMDHYKKCRQAEAIRWINLQEKRASIMARLQPVTPEEYQAHRDAITSESGPLRRKGMNSCYPCGIEFITTLHSPKANHPKSKIQNRQHRENFERPI